MRIYAWATSDVGMKRSHNEDCYLIANDVRLFAVADGMGGYNAGEVAAALAVQTIDSYVNDRAAALPAITALPASTSTDDVDALSGALLQGAVRAANGAIRAASAREPAYRGMGTTTTALLLLGAGEEARAHIAHVGDSRCYRVRRDRPAQRRPLPRRATSEGRAHYARAGAPEPVQEHHHAFGRHRRPRRHRRCQH